MQAENQTEWELTEMLTAKELLGRAQALEPQLVEWRRTLHRHPEVGFDQGHRLQLSPGSP